MLFFNLQLTIKMYINYVIVFKHILGVLYIFQISIFFRLNQHNKYIQHTNFEKEHTLRTLLVS